MEWRGQNRMYMYERPSHSAADKPLPVLQMKSGIVLESWPCWCLLTVPETLKRWYSTEINHEVSALSKNISVVSVTYAYSPRELVQTPAFQLVLCLRASEVWRFCTTACTFGGAISIGLGSVSRAVSSIYALERFGKSLILSHIWIRSENLEKFPIRLGPESQPGAGGRVYLSL